MKQSERVSWEEAFAAELAAAKARRPDDTAVDKRLVGLAFSGGGIRSALATKLLTT